MKNIIILLFLITTFYSCKAPEARRPISVKSGSFINESIELNKKLNAEQYERIQNIINNNPDIKYIASDNGFWYYYHTKVEAEINTADFGDLLNFDFNISDIEGTIIYSESELGNKDYVMDKEELFSGLREGLKLMKPGETISFLFPAQKAYGFYGDEDKIGSNLSIQCKVTLNSIQKN